MKNKLEKQNMENQMRDAADWEPLARGILQEPRLFQIGFVGICEGAGATTVAAAAAAVIGRQHGRTVFAEGQRPQPGRMRTLDYLGLEQVLKKGKLPIYQDVNWQIAGFGGRARDDFGDGGRQGRGVNRRRTDESPRGGFAAVLPGSHGYFPTDFPGNGTAWCDAHPPRLPARGLRRI